MEWIPINPPKPQDEHIYDIRLKTGEVICDVEYWRFGGGFCELSVDDERPNEEENQMVKYPLHKVEAYAQVIK